MPFDLSDDNITRVASKISGAAGSLGAEVIEMRNWLLCFGCAPEDFIVVVADLSDWMYNFPPPRAAYRALMECRLVSLDKRPGV